MSTEAATAKHRVLLRLPEVIRRTTLKKSAIYTRMKLKKFPAQVKIGRNAGWLEHEIDALIAAEAAGRAR